MTEQGPVQTRHDNGKLQFFFTVHEAFEAAEKDAGIWKISWNDADKFRVRFVRDINGSWIYESIMGKKIFSEKEIQKIQHPRQTWPIRIISANICEGR